MNIQVALLSDAIPFPTFGQEPPKELLLFKWGVNHTTKGPLYLTPEGAKKAVESYRKHGVARCFDAWHSTVDPKIPPHLKKATGYWGLFTNEKGLCAREIRFIPRVENEVRAGEWPFYSPVAKHINRNIIDVPSIGLTTMPATENAQLLLASEGIEMDTAETTETTDLRSLMDATQTLLTVAQKVGASSNESLKTLAEKAVSGITDVISGLQNLAQEMGVSGEQADQSELSEALELLSFCQDLTQKNKVPVIKGTLRGWNKRIQDLTGKLSDNKKRRLEELVDKGIRDRLIQEAEREQFLSLSADEVESYLDTTTPIFEIPLSDAREAKPDPAQQKPNGAVRGDDECQRLLSLLQ